MAKRSVLGGGFYVGSADISGDIGAIQSAASTRALQDVSGINVSGTERIVLRSDGEISYAAFWNAAAAAAVDTLQLAENVLVTFADGGELGSYACTLEANKVNFSTVSGQDGSLGITGQALGSRGTRLEWGQLLSIGKQTIASTQAISAWVAATNYSINDLVVPTVANGHYYKVTTDAGSSHATDEPVWPTNGSTVVDQGITWTDQGLLPNGIDGLASTSFGLAAYLHVFSIGSGSATVTIQDSANRIAWANVTGGAFTAVTGVTTQRIQTATNGTVRRYVRVNVTGIFTNLVAVVNFVRYLNQQP